MISQDLNPIQKLQRFCNVVWNGIDFKTIDVRKSSYVFRFESSEKKLAFEVEKFYTEDKEKRTPYDKLNETKENRKRFFIGFFAADGSKNNKQKCISFFQKHNFTMFSIKCLCQSLGLQTCKNMKDDKFNIFELISVKKQSDG